MMRELGWSDLDMFAFRLVVLSEELVATFIFDVSGRWQPEAQFSHLLLKGVS
jgi:hypothetical protein